MRANSLLAFLGLQSQPLKQPGRAKAMTATKTRTTARKSAAKKTAAVEHSVWVQKLNKLAEPLRGKLTKAIAQK